jgi:hypothetical protein
VPARATARACGRRLISRACEVRGLASQLLLLRAPMTKLIALLLPLSIAACATSPEEVATDDQASTIYNNCAVNDNADAGETSINVGDSYTRKASTINTTCQCSQWQVIDTGSGANDGLAAANKKFPKCQPTTIVDFNLGTGAAYDLTGVVSSWPDLTMGSLRETQCTNSTVFVKLEKFNHTTNSYDIIDHSDAQHPSFSNNTCGPAGATFKAIVTPGTEQDFRVRALGTIGLDADDHGFETISVTVQPDDVISG